MPLDHIFFLLILIQITLLKGFKLDQNSSSEYEAPSQATALQPKTSTTPFQAQWWGRHPPRLRFTQASFPWICYCDNFLGKVLAYSTETTTLQISSGGTLTVPIAMRVAILDCTDQFVGSFNPPSICAARYPGLVGSLATTAVDQACTVNYNLANQVGFVAVVGGTGCSEGPSSSDPSPPCSTFQSPYFFEALVKNIYRPEKCPFFASATASGSLNNIANRLVYLGCMGCYNGLDCVCT